MKYRPYSEKNSHAKMKTIGRSRTVDISMHFKTMVRCRYRERNICRLYKLFTKNMNKKSGKNTLIVAATDATLIESAFDVPNESETAIFSAIENATVRYTMSAITNPYLKLG